MYMVWFYFDLSANWMAEGGLLLGYIIGSGGACRIVPWRVMGQLLRP